MRWRGRRESQNIEDRRGMRAGFPGRMPMGGRIGGGRIGGRGLAGGGLGAIVIVVVALLFGIDPGLLFEGASVGTPSQVGYQAQPAPTSNAGQDEDTKRFIAVVLAETETAWRGVFHELGHSYDEPTLVLFNGQVRSACGSASAAVGPFYCPGDQKVYLDLSFFEDLKSRFGAPGDFAQAYVVAHEVGHHVQNLLGILPQVDAMRRRVSNADANKLSVMLELQADCFSGVWARRANAASTLLEPGDIDEGLNAANAIGDDRLQRQAQGYVVPDSFTHGSSAQRQRWFRRGFENGSLETCDTFNAARL
ncbi:MAG: neutral zinc metallopeptidase [Hyphomicrobiales bacterium]|nr:neutral zinc metallopeptidase [Hyphomicrobiales bacterium]